MKDSMLKKGGLPAATGLYDPNNEHDSCGVGFVANIKGVPSHQILQDAYHINSRMDHRGGCGFEENTGDGAGILTALPFSFFAEVAAEIGIKLPEPGRFAVGNIFLPQDEAERAICMSNIEAIIGEEHQTFLGWRDVPVDADKADVGPAARNAQPVIKQLFIGSTTEQERFDR
ncbi:MAG: glutamate synthase (NADPH/NADH) large chain, partial [Candidatus Azotimanducaceae bacterium]